MFDIVPQKLCKKCNQHLPATPEFWHKDKKGLNGLSSTCKECKKAKSREWHHENQEYANQRSHEYYETHIPERREYIEANAEKIAQQKREWRQNNPELVAAEKKRHYERHKAKIRIYQKSWRAKNRKRLLADGRKYYLENADIIRKRSRDWAKANPEKALNNFHKRRALKLGNGGDGYTKEDKALQLRSQKGLCWWCSKPMGKDITEDHVIALNRGGQHTPRNIVLAHKSCNCSKKDKSPQEWAGRLF